MFRRAPGFFDVVTYEGSGELFPVVPHNLGVVPEMMWIKNRDFNQQWAVYHKDVSASAPHFEMVLNDSVPLANASTTYAPFAGIPTATDMLLKDGYGSSKVGDNHIAYLFASVPGICDIGSYTGVGNTDIDIDCGFINGARFVLIKQTDASGGWYVWDTERGISGGNDPFIELNSTSAQTVSLNVLNPLSSGFTINADSNNYPVINGSGGEYIYMAIA